jgi:sensor histidine kinase YesM
MVFLSFILFLLSVPGIPVMAGEQFDTTLINRQNKEALVIARRNPDLAIFQAHNALYESRSSNYTRGLAEASLALGTAWLAKYNRGDSALYYNLQAYNLFQNIDDNRGKARACYGLAYVFSFKGNLKESEKYSALSLEFFENAGDKKGMINSLNALSYLAKQQKDFIRAQEHIHKAIAVAGSIHDTLPLADAKNSLGNIYKDMAFFKQAIDAYFEALDLWEMKKDSAGISIAYGSIGLMYFYQKEWDKALEFCLKKVRLSKASGDLWELSKTYNTMAQIYNSKTKSDSALLYLRKGLELNNEMNFPSGIGASYHNIATTFLLQENIDSAMWYINKAVLIAIQIDDPSLVNFYVTLGKIHMAAKNYPLALDNALKAYKLAKKRNLPMVLHESSSLLSDIYHKLNRNDIAYIYLKEYQQLNDSISNDEFLKKVTRLEIQYDFDKKQKSAEFAQAEERIIHEKKIKQKNLYLTGLAILFILITLLFILYIRNNRLRSRYARIALEQKLLRIQMNPHFIFNSLCAVQNLIISGSPAKANSYLAKIAKLMRNILENSLEEFISLDKEIETIRLYLDLQQLRFASGFEYSIIIDKAIDAGNISVPPMLTQPLVENSVEHGFLQKKEKGRLSVEYSLRNGLIKVEVIDNGVGRKEAAAIVPNQNKKQFISTLLTDKRLEYFRKSLKQKSIRREVTDIYENGMAAGTKVVLLLPYKTIFA